MSRTAPENVANHVCDTICLMAEGMNNEDKFTFIHTILREIADRCERKGNWVMPIFTKN